VRDLITLFLNKVMKEEADQQAGAGRYRRTSSRKTYRNGYGTGLSRPGMGN